MSTRAPHSSRAALAALCVLVLASAACNASGETAVTSTPAPAATESGPSESEDSGDGSETAALEDSCGCGEGELCVGTCYWGDFGGGSLGDPRCIDASACEEGIDTPACRMQACGSALLDVRDTCYGDEEGYDVICEEIMGASCSAIDQDCPVDLKCVLNLVPEDYEYDSYASQCVEITGSDAPSEPCSSDGSAQNSTDSCDAAGMCWSGALSLEPFMGTCHPFCTYDYEAEMATCPPGLTCTNISPTGSFWLCI